MRLALGSWAAQAAQEAKEEAARAEGYRAAIEAIWARSQPRSPRAQDGAPTESGAAAAAEEAERLSAALSPQPSATWPTAAASETRGMGGPSAQQERVVGELVEAAEREEAEMARLAAEVLAIQKRLADTATAREVLRKLAAQRTEALERLRVGLDEDDARAAQAVLEAAMLKTARVLPPPSPPEAIMEAMKREARSRQLEALNTALRAPPPPPAVQTAAQLQDALAVAVKTEDFRYAARLQAELRTPERQAELARDAAAAAEAAEAAEEAEALRRATNEGVAFLLRRRLNADGSRVAPEGLDEDEGDEDEDEKAQRGGSAADPWTRRRAQEGKAPGTPGTPGAPGTRGGLDEEDEDPDAFVDERWS